MNGYQFLKEINYGYIADVKAICKARGFFLKNASDPGFLKNFLISDQEIKEAISELSKDEVILLYMLSQESEAVDISFFDCVYGPEKRDF